MNLMPAIEAGSQVWVKREHIDVCVRMSHVCVYVCGGVRTHPTRIRTQRTQRTQHTQRTQRTCVCVRAHDRCADALAHRYTLGTMRSRNVADMLSGVN